MRWFTLREIFIVTPNVTPNVTPVTNKVLICNEIMNYGTSNFIVLRCLCLSFSHSNNHMVSHKDNHKDNHMDIHKRNKLTLLPDENASPEEISLAQKSIDILKRHLQNEEQHRSVPYGE